MSSEQTTPGRRRRRLLSPQEKWEAFLEVTSRELTQADTARKWGTSCWMIWIRRCIDVAFGLCGTPTICADSDTQPVRLGMGGLFRVGRYPLVV